MYQQLLAVDESDNNVTQQSLKEALAAVHIGLLNEGKFQPVWVSQSPYSLSHGQWQVAVLMAQSLGELFAGVSRNERWIKRALGTVPANSLAAQLSARLPEGSRRASNVFITRHDIMLDSEQNWKLIESNSIAAGMGPFSDGVANLLAQRTSQPFAPNGATKLQAQTLYDAACDNRGVVDPVLIFVVERNEDNVFDQQKLATEITRLGGSVVFETLQQIHAEQVPAMDEALCLRHIGVVDLLYFRTGYNIADYQDETGDVRALLDLRAKLEQMHIKVCPSIAGQLATHKIVQRRLSELSVSALMGQFQLSVQRAIFATLALSVKYQDIDFATLPSKLNSGQWLLKGSGEGGGNVYSSYPTLTDTQITDDAFLMQRIHPHVRTERVECVRYNEQREYDRAVSELGVFTVGDDHAYGGYLLRTKPEQALECGVHKGFGAIDSVILKPS